MVFFEGAADASTTAPEAVGAEPAAGDGAMFLAMVPLYMIGYPK
jgi:hypothetical protein